MALTQSQRSTLDKMLHVRYEVLLERCRDAQEKNEYERWIELIRRTPADIGNEANAKIQANLAPEFVDWHVQEIRATETALLRLRDHSYGLCVSCGNDIDYEHLFAHPTAKRCIACERRHEKAFDAAR